MGNLIAACFLVVAGGVWMTVPDHKTGLLVILAMGITSVASFSAGFLYAMGARHAGQ